jgi:hypothetical protein
MFETPKTRVIAGFSPFSPQLQQFMPSLCNMWQIIGILVTLAKKIVMLAAPWRRHWAKMGVFRTLAVLGRNFCLQPNGELGSHKINLAVIW